MDATRGSAGAGGGAGAGEGWGLGKDKAGKRVCEGRGRVSVCNGPRCASKYGGATNRADGGKGVEASKSGGNLPGAVGLQLSVVCVQGEHLQSVLEELHTGGTKQVSNRCGQEDGTKLRQTQTQIGTHR